MCARVSLMLITSFRKDLSHLGKCFKNGDIKKKGEKWLVTLGYIFYICLNAFSFQ